jgi:hypothetical protein
MSSPTDFSTLIDSLKNSQGDFNLSDVPTSSSLDLTLAPSSQAGYSDYYNDNNFIGAGVDNQIIDSQRCSILQGSSNYISGMYNTHIVGDYIGLGGHTDIQNNSFNIGCYNGIKSWGPLSIERGGANINGRIQCNSSLKIESLNQGYSYIDLKSINDNPNDYSYIIDTTSEAYLSLRRNVLDNGGGISGVYIEDTRYDLSYVQLNESEIDQVIEGTFMITLDQYQNLRDFTYHNSRRTSYDIQILYLGKDFFKVKEAGDYHVRIRQGFREDLSVMDKLELEATTTNIWYNSGWFLVSKKNTTQEFSASYLFAFGDWVLDTTKREGWFFNTLFRYFFVSTIPGNIKSTWFSIKLKKNNVETEYWFWTRKDFMQQDGFIFVNNPSNTGLKQGWIEIFKDSKDIYDMIFYAHEESKWYGFTTNIYSGKGAFSGTITEIIDLDGRTLSESVLETTDEDLSDNDIYVEIENDEYNLHIQSYGVDNVSNLFVEGDVVAYHSSDERLKEDISKLTNCLDNLMKIKGVRFNWKKNVIGKTQDIGLIAQDVKKIAPEIVQERSDGFLAIKYEKMVPLLVGAIQDQQEIINELKSEIETLKSKTNHL